MSRNCSAPLPAGALTGRRLRGAIRRRAGRRARRTPPSPVASSSPRAKAVDVVVVGSSLAGLLAASRLSSRAGGGRKVAVVEVSSQPAGRGGHRRQQQQPFHLPHSHQLNTFLAAEALAVWSSLGRDMDTQLLLSPGSLHMMLSSEGATRRELQEASGRLESLQTICTAAQIAFDVLTPDEVRFRFPFLRAPPGSRSLFQTSGGVLLADKARGVLERVCARSGVDIRNARVSGWRDGGGYFQLRTSDGDSGGMLIEAEQLLLAPSQAEAESVFRMFGLRGGLQRREALVGEWHATSDMARSPLVRVAQNDVNVADEESPGLSILPRLEGSSVCQATLSPYIRPKPTTQEIEESRRRQEEEEDGEGGAGLIGDAPLVSPLALQAAATRLSSSVARVTSALDLAEPPDRAFIASELTTADGFSLLGSHPGWEEGQVVVSVPTYGAHGDGGASLSGSLGILAASAIQGIPNPYGSKHADRMALSRDSLGMQYALPEIDTWAELGLLESPKPPASKKMVPTTRASQANRDRKYYT